MKSTPTTANRVLAVMSKMFNLAEKLGLRPDGSNPCRHVEKYPEKKLHRDLTEIETARLAKVLRDAEHARSGPSVAVRDRRCIGGCNEPGSVGPALPGRGSGAGPFA